MQVIRNFCLLILVVVTGAAFAAPTDDLLANKWSLAILQKQPIILENFKSVKPFIKFAPDNTFTAYAGCNDLSGTYVLTAPNGLKITPNVPVPNPAVTCATEFTQIESTFISMLMEVQSWSIDGNILSVFGTPDNTIALFSSNEPY